jgi:catechol 2,3-dioxygenase-like lactoylglutathione lyase family enzyme
MPMFLGLRTIVYPAADLAASTAWFTRVLGIQPYFDQPFYVGFSVGGYELGLDPDSDTQTTPLTYWGVTDIDAALKHLLELGAIRHQDVEEIGDRIRVATVREPGGSIFGIIENPHFIASPEGTGTEPGGIG